MWRLWRLRTPATALASSAVVAMLGTTDSTSCLASDKAQPYQRAFAGELTPPRPEGKLWPQPIAWQKGPYGSWFLRVSATATAKGLSQSIGEACSRAKEDLVAVYVGIPEESMQPGWTEVLRECGLAYHHHLNGEFIYYKWCGDPSHDKVPAYSTSIEGAGAIIISPDKRKVPSSPYEQWSL